MAKPMIKLNTIKPNPSNPRTVDCSQLSKLKKSIQDFPKMMELRPMVVDAEGYVLGGNMRLKALKELGYKEIPDDWVKRAEELTEDERKRFIISDNVGFGDWDWDMLANEWDSDKLTEWGLEITGFDAEAEKLDYGILDEDDQAGKIDELSGGVKKAIQIEFEQEHYEAAFELVKFWRNKGAYVGGMIMEHLKQEKEKLSESDTYRQRAEPKPAITI